MNESGEDYSPLGLGILHGHLDVVKLLLKAGADPNHFQRSRSGTANGTAMGNDKTFLDFNLTYDLSGCDTPSNGQ